MAKSDKEEKVQRNYRLEPSLLTRMEAARKRAEVANPGFSISEVDILRRALLSWLDEDEAKSKKK